MQQANQKSEITNHKSVAAACIALLTAVLLGCGKGDGFERVIVSGTVSYDGKPLPVGTIQFVPPPTSSIPMAGAIVTDGKYRIAARGGAAVGKYKVQFEAIRGTNRAGADPRSTGLEQYIPAKYNVRTELEITIESGSRQITKNFDLTP